MNELETIQSIVKNAIHPAGYNLEEENALKEKVNLLTEIFYNPNKLAELDDQFIDSLSVSGMIKHSDALLLKSYKISLKYKKAIDNNKLKSVLNDTIGKLKSTLNKFTNKKASALSKKIEHGFINLTEEDIDNLFDIVKKDDKYTLENKRDLLLYVSLNLVNGIEDEYEEDYIEIEDSKKGLSLEQLSELFNKHHYSITLLSDKNIDELLRRGNYEQMDKILTLLDNNGINLTNNNNHNILLEKQDNLREILIRSNEHCTSEMLNFAREYGITNNGEINFYKLACTPGKFALKQRPYRKKISIINTGPKPESDKFSGTHQDFMANVKYFSTICEELYGKDINFIKKYYEHRNGILLDYPHEKILEIVNILETYGFNKRDFFSQATTVFYSIHQADVLDFAIERGMYDYIKQNPSRLILDKKIFDVLYVASLDKKKYMDEEMKQDFAGNRTLHPELKLKDINEYLRDHPIKEEKKGIVLDEKMVEQYEETIRAYPFDISISDKDTNIKLLEENFKVNDLLYNIGGVNISRLKVLRIYNALKENPLDDDKNKFIYALTRNTYMDNNEYTNMVNAYNEVANAKKKNMGGQK